MPESPSSVRGVLRLLSIVLAWMLAADLAVAEPAGRTDVRILIDISGSMRQNDPDNLRRPALRMLAGLLQPDTRAGVWTFAKWVNNLVPVAEVDAAWKTRIQSLSKKINSPGQFTNIEEVLLKASADWEGAAEGEARHLILLTDGMVDVSKQADENAQSRARIIDEILPRLQSAKVRVHTIALSERADHELMKRLAGETGGWYQQVAQAEELQRAFLRMFETVGTPDALPLEDNRFTVDASISEATVLLFSKADAPPPVLFSPSGEEFTDSDLTAGVAWYRDQGYDLITIASPAKGEWRLRADLDPDNRVMVVTDLRLQVSEVPAHIAADEPVRIEAYLSNKGELVSRPAFLRLLEVRADATTDEGRAPIDLNDRGEADDEAAGDGRFTMRYAEPRPRDSVELLVSVDSPTFMREKRLRLAVHDAAVGEVVDTADGAVLKVRPETAVLQPDLQIEAWQQGADGARTVLQGQSADDGVWQASLIEADQPAFFKVAGRSRLGNLVTRTGGPLMRPGVPPPAPPQPAAEAEPEPEPTPPVEAPAPVEQQPPAVEPVDEPPPQEAAAEEAGWLMPVLAFAGFNLLLLGGAGAWWFLRRRRAGTDDEFDFDELVGGGGEAKQPAGDAPEEHAA